MTKRESQQWQEIINKNPFWFSSGAMKFWNSKVYWDTLTEDNEGWKFVSSEDTFDRQSVRYTIRLATENGITEASEFLEFATLEDALKAL